MRSSRHREASFVRASRLYGGHDAHCDPVRHLLGRQEYPKRCLRLTSGLKELLKPKGVCDMLEWTDPRRRFPRVPVNGVLLSHVRQHV